MTGNSETKIVDIAEFFVEVHHVRGNISKFEYLGVEIADEESEYSIANAEAIELGVWDFRSRDHMDWHVGFAMDETMGQVARFRVTRYLDLEKDMDDVTYHPSVPSWYIDTEKVREHFYANASE